MAHPVYKDSDGKRLPSVTTVLGRFKDSGALIYWANKMGLEGKTLEDARQPAMTTGTIVHSMVEFHIKGDAYDPPADTAPEVLAAAQRAFDAFFNWTTQTSMKITSTEVSLVSPLGFGGTLDAIGEVNGERVLVDWKTSNDVYREYLVQMAAYTHLWETAHLDQPIAGMHLCRFGKEDGSFHHHSYPRSTLDAAWELFPVLLRAYNLDRDLKKFCK